MNRNPNTLVLPQFSNREDFYYPFQVFDDDTNELVDMTALGWTFQFEVRRLPPRGSGRAWVGPYYDDDDTDRPLIVLALGTGVDSVSILDVGVGLIWISETNMRKLRHRTYRAALVGNDGTRAFEIFNATLPIDCGGVTN
jgi:hypothetical protein